MNSLNIAVIGIGNMGHFHAKAIYEKQVTGLRLTAVCDNDPAVLNAAKAEFSGVDCYLDYWQLLQSPKVQAVIIATPHYLHPVIACAAFQSGLHVLTEKPAGVRVSDAEEMNAAAKQSGKVFGIMWNQRTNKLFQKAREILKTGQLGTPKRLVWIITNWYRTQGYYNSGSWRATWAGEGGGVLLNQAPHNLDLWQWIFGMPQSIYASCDVGKYHQIEVEDDVTLLAKYQNGATATFITSTGEYPGTNRLEISGSLGKMVLENGTLTLTKTAEDEREFCNSRQASPKIPVTTTVFKDEPGKEPHLQILEDFAKAVLTGSPLLAPGEQGVLELTLSNAAYLSAWTGKPVTLPLNNAEFNAHLAKRIAHSCKKQSADPNVYSGDLARWQVKW